MAFVMTGCDKWDCNGDLDGMWQLTEWRDKNNVVKATKQDMIFYSFQLQMASFRKKKGEPNYIRSLMRKLLSMTPSSMWATGMMRFSRCRFSQVSECRLTASSASKS